MSISRTNRGVRLAGAIVLVGALITGPLAGTGSAAPVLSSYSGEGSGFALRVVVDLAGLPKPVRDEISTAYGSFLAGLPTEAAALLPEQFPFTIDQRFIETLSQAGAVTKGLSLLGTGFTEKAEATSVGQNASTTALAQKLPSADLPVLDIAVGELTASIVEGPTVSATGVIAEVKATLEAVGALLPAELAGLFDDLVASINEAITTVNTELDAALGDVADTLVETVEGEPTGLVGTILGEAGLTTDDVDALATQLTDAVQIPTISNPLETVLASVKGLDNSAVTQKTADDKAMADATSKIASVDVLGLLQVGAIDLSSHSEAAGTAGSAKNSGNCSIADVKIGDANSGVALDGKTLYIDGLAVPVPDVDVAAIKGAVDEVLATVGLSVALCDASTAEAAPDGTSASQSVSAFRVEFAPKAPADITALGVSAGDQLVKVIIDPTVETSVAAVVATEEEVGVTLPATGAAPLATVIFGAALTIGALILRRRLA